MATNTEVARQDTGARTESPTTPAKQGSQSETPIRPPVDICEDANGITLRADMPGVSRDRLDLQADGRTLTIEGRIQFGLPKGAAAVHADVHSSVYRRSFALSGELATDEIDASLKDGVLTVRIPRRAELRPRKIKIRVP